MQQRDTESLGFSIVNYKGSKDDLSEDRWSAILDNGNHKLREISTSGRTSHLSVAQGRKKLKKKPELSPSDARTWISENCPIEREFRLNTNLKIQPSTIRASSFPLALMGAVKLEVKLQQLTPTTSAWMQTGIVWDSCLWSDLGIFLSHSSLSWQWAARLYSS